ncbi:MAG: hypothetical protein E6I76_08380 [Chloroflexi bacterium]|nr:MAG: hypothetical protein E6I76_08380 [Chloroflexota bacterium]
MNRTSTLHRLRTAGIGLCLGGVAISAWSSAISVRAANSGDIFIQSAGAGAPSGHATDPHLSCADIDLWGAGLADPSSTFTIAGAPPSGSDETVYSASWSYSSAVADPQIIAVVPVATLISDAAAAGDTPQANGGYHFKIDFTQNSQKATTFWIDCPAPSGDPGTGSTGSGGGTTTTTSSSSGSTDAGTTTSSTTTSTDAGTTTSSSSTTTTSTDAGTTSTGSSSTSTDAAPLVQEGSTTTSTSTSTQSSSAGTSSADGASGENGLSNGSATIGSLGSGATTSSSSTTTQSAPQTSTTASTTSSATGGNIGVSITAPAPTPAPAAVPASAPLLPTAASDPPAPNTGADVPFGLGLLLLLGGAGTIAVSSALRRRRA